MTISDLTRLAASYSIDLPEPLPPNGSSGASGTVTGQETIAGHMTCSDDAIGVAVLNE